MTRDEAIKKVEEIIKQYEYQTKILTVGTYLSALSLLADLRGWKDADYDSYGKTLPPP
jgi:hypothetical protein